MGEVGHIKPIMDELNMDSSLFVDHVDYDIELLKTNVQKSWDNRDDIRRSMKAALPGLREKALMNARLACKLLEQNSAAQLINNKA